MKILVLLLILMFPSSCSAERFSVLIATELEKVKLPVKRSVLVKRQAPAIQYTPVKIYNPYIFTPTGTCVRCLDY